MVETALNLTSTIANITNITNATQLLALNSTSPNATAYAALTADFVKGGTVINLSWPFMVGYAAYFIFYTLVTGFAFKFDNCFGQARTLLKLKAQGRCIEVCIVIFNVLSVCIPIIIGIMWGVWLGNNNQTTLTVLSVVFGSFFVSFTFIGFLQWYGSNWVELNWARECFIMAVISCWVFCIALTCSPDSYSFIGMTATLLTINFLSILFFIYNKALWRDINLNHLS